MLRAAPRRERKSTLTSFALKVRAYGSFSSLVSPSPSSSSSAARSIGTKRFGRAVTARRFGVRPKRLRAATSDGGGDGETGERRDDGHADGDCAGSARKRLKFEASTTLGLAAEEDADSETKAANASPQEGQARRMRPGASVTCDDEFDRAVDEKSDGEQEGRDDDAAALAALAAVATATGDRESKEETGEEKAERKSATLGGDRVVATGDGDDEKRRCPRKARRSIAARALDAVPVPNLELEEALDDIDGFTALMRSVDDVAGDGSTRSEEDAPSSEDCDDGSCDGEHKDGSRDDERKDDAADRPTRAIARTSTSRPEKKRPDVKSSDEAPSEPTAVEASDMRDLKSLAAKPQCPLCRGDTRVGAADTASLAVSSVGAYRILFGSLKIRCPLHAGAGCTWTGDYTDMHKHLLYSCAEHPIVCFNCHAHYRRRDMVAHLAACPQRSVTCVECGREGEFRHAERHRAVDCPMAIVRCWSRLSETDGGCNKRMRRKHVDEHRRRTCKMRRVPCAYGCAEPVLWSAVDAHNARNAVRHLAFAGDRIEKLERRLEAYELRLPATAADVASSRPDVMYGRDDSEAVSRVIWLDIGVRRRHGDVVEWRRLAEVPSLRYGWTIAQTERGLFVIGGSDTPDEDVPTDSNDYFDFKTAMWKRCAPLPTPLVGHTVTALTIGDDSLMYVVGGRGMPRHCCVYDPSDDTWSERPAPAVDRWGHAAAACGGQLYVFGGHSRATECYDPVANQWTTCASMKKARCYAAAVVIDAFIYVMGGVATSAASSSPPTSRWTASVERYDTRTNTWTVVGWKLPRAMSSFTAHYDAGRGSIVVAGGVRPLDGSSTAYRNPTSSTEIYSLDLSSDSAEWRVI